MSNTRNQDDEILTPEGLAEEIAIPIRTLYQWRYQGKGPRSMKLGRHVRYRRSDIKAWLEAQASEPAAS